MWAVSLAGVAHARQHALPATLSPGYRNTSISPWGDQRARQATIATILARRATQPQVPSVAELTERQSSLTTTELQYIPHQHPGRRRTKRPKDLSMSRGGAKGASDRIEDATKGREETARERERRRVRAKAGLGPEAAKKSATSGWPEETSADVAAAAFPNGHEFSGGSRCGESWDDAAVKCGTECTSGCPLGVQDMCYLDLPVCDHKNPAGRCWAYSGGVSDSWCVTASAMLDGSDRSQDKSDAFYNLCICEEVVVGPQTVTDRFEEPINATNLPPRDAELVAIVIEEADKHPGLPECTWQPPKGCTNVTQYECVEGAAANRCSGESTRFNACSPYGPRLCIHTIRAGMRPCASWLPQFVSQARTGSTSPSSAPPAACTRRSSARLPTTQCGGRAPAHGPGPPTLCCRTTLLRMPCGSMPKVPSW